MRGSSDEQGVAGRLICDLTQSWSEVGGGVATYLRHKRDHILAETAHRHLLIIPGPRDEVVQEGRATTVRIASPKVPGSPNYRLLLRSGAVREALAEFEPDLIECQDAYNLPWAALSHRRERPATVLVAGYFTDFPTVYVQRPFGKYAGRAVGEACGRLCYRYCRQLYRRFDAVYGLSENGGVAKLRKLGVDDVAVLPLGVDLADFGPERRDPELRRSLGLADGQPLLVYAGRMDSERRPDIVADAFRRLPSGLGAKLALLGDGPMRSRLAGPGILAPGFVRGREELARWLASADIYVSAMADETFGVSVIEAQASALPIVGVAAGAMIDRVDASMGRLGPVGDAATMAANIVEVWNSDPRAMGRAARAHAEREFSWAHTMEVLFGAIYPHAFACAAARRQALAGARRPSYAEA